MKLILEGWWDQVKMRQGWSDKISKWQWVSLQILIPIAFASAIILMIASFTQDKSWLNSLWIAYGIAIFTSLANHKAWNRDQARMERV